jgi:hypothetical protein
VNILRKIDKGSTAHKLLQSIAVGLRGPRQKSDISRNNPGTSATSFAELMRDAKSRAQIARNLANGIEGDQTELASAILLSPSAFAAVIRGVMALAQSEADNRSGLSRRILLALLAQSGIAESIARLKALCIGPFAAVDALALRLAGATEENVMVLASPSDVEGLASLAHALRGQPAGLYDIAILSSILSEARDPVTFLSEVKRVAKNYALVAVAEELATCTSAGPFNSIARMDKLLDQLGTEIAFRSERHTRFRHPSGQHIVIVRLEPAPARRLLFDELALEAEALKIFMTSRSKSKLVELVGQDLVDQFATGFEDYCRTGASEPTSYHAMRQICLATRGETDDFFFSTAAATIFPAAPVPEESESAHFKSYSRGSVGRAIKDVKDRALHIFHDMLAPEVIAEIRTHLIGLPVTNDYGRDVGIFPIVGDTPRVFFAEIDLLRCRAIRALALDPVLVNIAGQLFGVEPVLDCVIGFHTRPHNCDAGVLSNAAQMLHRDRDRLNFLKIFIYIEDVTEENGPHCLIAGSHRGQAREFWQDRRYTDDEIERVYSTKNFVFVTGPAGTVFAANTSALHKGTPPRQASRTLLQIQYASSLFGAPYNEPESNPFQKDAIDWKEEGRPLSRLLIRFPSRSSDRSGPVEGTRLA